MIQNYRLLPTTLKTTVMRNGAAVNLIDIEYAYDAAANVQNIFDYRDSTKLRSMTYDGVNRLRTATGPCAITHEPSSRVISVSR